jgi:hypothetical protein
MSPRSRRWIWLAAGIVIILVLLPMPIAERYTSPTQDGQYLRHPLRSYQFVIAAARGSTSSQLNTSGEALALAKQVFAGTDLRPTSVELLFVPNEDPYTYLTREGSILTASEHGTFVWEVWGTTAGGTSSPDVIALIDYASGEVVASLE